MDEEKERAAGALARALYAESSGDAHARRYFEQITRIYPGTPEAAEAAKALERIRQHPERADPEPVAAPPPQLGSTTGPAMRVTVVDLDISFGQLVSLFVKAAIAMIPAAIILSALGFIVMVVIGGLANAR